MSDDAADPLEPGDGPLHGLGLGAGEGAPLTVIHLLGTGEHLRTVAPGLRELIRHRPELATLRHRVLDTPLEASAFLGLAAFADGPDHQRLAPAHNSLKAHVLYHRLTHDLALGAPDRDRFMAYLRLPRRGSYANPEYIRRGRRGDAVVNTAQRYTTGLDPIGNDEPLVYAYLEHFFGDTETFQPYAEYVRGDYLRRVFATTKILAGAGDLDAKVEHALPSEVAERIATVVRNASAQVRQYLVTKTLISAATGFLIALILWILGVDFPLLWGFLAFLLNFIPNIGSLLSVVLPFLLSLLQFDTLTRPIIALVLMEVVQIVMGNVIEPRVMAFSLNLSPLLVLVSLIFWGSLWGILGMVLAVPLTATIKIIFENIEPLRPVAVLMGGELKPKGG